jgi:predicted RNA-binding Zn-ribbon protein involved in translation (DUF1610 family)
MVKTRDEALAYIKEAHPDDYFTKAKSGYMCPLCDNETGVAQTGIETYPKNSNTYKCFKCGFYGDILSFIAAENNLDCMEDFHQVLGKACLIYGITVDESYVRKQW